MKRDELIELLKTLPPEDDVVILTGRSISSPQDVIGAKRVMYKGFGKNECLFIELIVDERQ